MPFVLVPHMLSKQDGYVAPDVPAVVQADDVKISAVDTTVT